MKVEFKNKIFIFSLLLYILSTFSNFKIFNIIIKFISIKQNITNSKENNKITIQYTLIYYTFVKINYVNLTESIFLTLTPV